MSNGKHFLIRAVAAAAISASAVVVLTDEDGGAELSTTATAIPATKPAWMQSAADPVAGHPKGSMKNSPADFA